MEDGEFDDQFVSGDAGASKTIPTQCSALRKGGFVVIKNRPCRITETSTSKTGKHGHAKVHLVGVDLFTGKKLEDICPSTHNMEVPHVARTDYSLMDIDHEGYLSLVDENNNVRDDLKIPETDLGEQIKTKFEADDPIKVTVLKAMDEESIIGYKADQ
ncbi:hypothetical protein GJ496_006708 [Pomphorhynchus laevis]|nr:hypothetical protein GJ496_006708 [Pomphorhynchus laevis]